MASAARMSAATRFAGWIRARARRSKGGEFLRELLRAAMRALGTFPIASADEDFAVLPAFFAMKLVYRHNEILFQHAKISRVPVLAALSEKNKQSFFSENCLNYLKSG
jgi:hypothetical protein